MPTLIKIVDFLKVYVFTNTLKDDQYGILKVDTVIKWHSCSFDLLLEFEKNIVLIARNENG